jgi:DNA-binding transcriptional MerR regulator
MFENETQQQNFAPDFSDIPALGDVNGLEQYLNNQTLAAQGLPVQTTSTPADSTASSTTGETTSGTGTTTTTPAADTVTLTKEQLNAILASRGVAQPQQTQPVTQQPQRAPTSYSAQDITFITKALQQGYSLQQINEFLVRQSRQYGDDRYSAQLAQRLAQVEDYLKTQEYKTLENAFVSKLTDFGNKFGLSEQDLVTFGNEALKHGINIAMGDVNFETVFRAIYPDQYAIRSRRMVPTATSQIYGGNSIPESGNRAQASRLEDAYVDSFLKGTMPNQYAALNKK